LTYQAIDKLAAVVIPQAEMNRVFTEYGGNTALMLGPMAEALKARGYETLMVLPAQAAIVELVEVPANEATLGNAPTWGEIFDQARAAELESAKLLLEAADTLKRLTLFLRSTMAREEAAAMLPHVEQLGRRLAEHYVSKG
ncbi:MAG: hypothetical protein WC683_18535, partial [bacterium]